MKIIILGAGQVGASLAESLVSEENDITIVETDAGRLAHLQDRLDLRAVTGNAAWPSVLRDAGADDETTAQTGDAGAGSETATQTDKAPADAKSKTKKGAAK